MSNPSQDKIWAGSSPNKSHFVEIIRGTAAYSFATSKSLVNYHKSWNKLKIKKQTNGPVAQLVEQFPFKEEVPGSNPGRPTKHIV